MWCRQCNLETNEPNCPMPIESLEALHEIFLNNIEEYEIRWNAYQGIHLDALYWKDDISGGIEQKSLIETINTLMGELSNREQEVLKARYGFEDGVGRTLEEVGQMLGVTRERIRQIEAKAIRKLSQPTKIQKLKDFYW